MQSIEAPVRPEGGQGTLIHLSRLRPARHNPRGKLVAADYTYNHREGCTEVSPACEWCYARVRNERFFAGENWGAGAPRRTRSDAYRKQPYKWDSHAKSLGVRLKVFGGSLMDFADNEVPADWRIDLWQTIRATSNLDWLMLTKRVPNVVRMLPADWGDGYENVWLGATVWDQKSADRDIPRLLRIPRRLHWISVEPMLGRIQIPAERLKQLGFVVIGGESGTHARPFDLDAAKCLLDACVRAGVPVFMKQLGKNPVRAGHERLQLLDPKGGNPEEWPAELQVRQFPNAPLAQRRA
ncbi:MAG: DUF5131 family protein [Candidatus Methylophosphatis roskildensis]